MKAVILAGGLGSRLSEETDVRPKPMVEVGGYPLLWHIMRNYAHQGITEFIVALGYKGEMIKRYFIDYVALSGNLRVGLRDGSISPDHSEREDWIVNLVDTGLASNTGGRVGRLAPWLGRETFLLTYGDGVADVDIQALIAFHRRQGKLATICAVRPPSRFGELEFRGEAEVVFSEKPQMGEGWINGGFMVLEPDVVDLVDGDDTSLEGDVLEELSRRGELVAYRHEKFWQCVDTLRELRYLRALWNEGNPPWATWE